MVVAAKSERAEEGANVPPAMAFEQVYAQHAAFVFRVLRGMGVHWASVDDAAQDVFVVVHNKLAAFEARAQVRTWLFEIAYRTACQYRRASARSAAQRPVLEADRSSHETPQQELERRQMVQLVAEAMETLDDVKRATLVLIDMEELTVPEAAELMQTSVNTVYTRLRRARTEFDAAFQRVQRRQR